MSILLLFQETIQLLILQRIAHHISFLGNNTGVYTQKVAVDIMGDSAGYDRTFKVKVVNQGTTANKSDYDIKGGVVKAGHFHGVLKVKLYNSKKLKNKFVSLHLKLVDSKDFKAGNVESNEILLKWTNQIVVPKWNYTYKRFFCQYPSTTAYRAIVISTGYKHINVDLTIKLTVAGMQALGKEFGDYVRHYNATHNKPLTHADGPAAGSPIDPVY